MKTPFGERYDDTARPTVRAWAPLLSATTIRKFGRLMLIDAPADAACASRRTSTPATTTTWRRRRRSPATPDGRRARITPPCHGRTSGRWGDGGDSGFGSPSAG